LSFRGPFTWPKGDKQRPSRVARSLESPILTPTPVGRFLDFCTAGNLRLGSTSVIQASVSSGGQPTSFHRAAAQRRRTFARRPSHDDEPRTLQVLRQALSDDVRHDLVAIVHTFAASESQREGERVDEFVGSGRLQVVSHAGSISGWGEQRKNILCRYLIADARSSVAEVA